MPHKSILKVNFLIFGALILLSYDDDPPNGHTGAPFDDNCNTCHTGNNPGGYDGFVEIVGLPDTILPNTVYALQIKATVTAGNPTRGGFQLVVVDKNNNNAGDLWADGAEADTAFLDGREYLDQRVAKYFNGMPIRWNFTWTSPAQTACNTIKFYYIVNYCNGSGDNGDFAKSFADSVYFKGGPDFMHALTTLQHNQCPENLKGKAQVTASGGVPPYTFLWSNGSTESQIQDLANGNYGVIIQDSVGCRHLDSTTILSFDTLSPALVCPPDFSVCAGDTVHYSLPSLSDNCLLENDLPYLWSGLPNDTIFPVGLSTLIFQANDSRGNTARCSYTVQVNASPEIYLDSILNDAGNAGTGAIYIHINGGSGPPFAYFWEKDGFPFATGLEDLTGLQAGLYGVSVGDSLGCSAKLYGWLVENTVLSTKALQTGKRFELHPNPAIHGKFQITGLANQPKAVSLWDLQGNILHTLSSEGLDHFYSVEKYPAGIYVLKIITEAGFTQSQILILMD